MDGQGQSDTTAINTVTAESTPTTVVEVEMANANSTADVQQSEQPNSQQLQQQQTIEPTPMSIVEPESQQKEQMLPPSTNSSLPVTEAAATTAVCNGVIEKESQQQTSNSAFEPYRAKQLLAAIDKAIERVGKSLRYVYSIANSTLRPFDLTILFYKPSPVSPNSNPASLVFQPITQPFSLQH